MEKLLLKMEEIEKNSSLSFKELKKSQTMNFRILLFYVCLLGLLAILV